MTPCSRCRTPHEGSHRYCKPCKAAYMREWRKTHPLTDEQRQRDTARSYAGVYLRRGKLQRKPCELCGDPAQMHHPDYDKPLEVVWLCRRCHLDLHREEHERAAADLRDLVDRLTDERCAT